MFMNVACPECGHRCRVAEHPLGQQVRYPACSKSYQCGPASPSLLATQSLLPEDALKRAQEEWRKLVPAGQMPPGRKSPPAGK
jgi:hypothetical protein